jgi:excisionase family DNA binding protein
MADLPNRYNLSKVAEMVGVHKLTIYRWEKAGRIPAVKRLARTKERIYYDADIERIIEYRDRTVSADELNDNKDGETQA